MNFMGNNLPKTKFVCLFQKLVVFFGGFSVRQQMDIVNEISHLDLQFGFRIFSNQLRIEKQKQHRRHR